MDAGLYSESIIAQRHCCRLAPTGKLRSAPDAEIGRYCASVGVILADIKLADDIQDNRSWRARIYRWFMRRSIRSAYSFLRGIDRDSTRGIQEFLRRHANLEKMGTAITIEEYCKPTAGAFGYVYGLLGKLCGSSSFQDTATAIGQEIGAALIAFDCAMDWETDQSTGDFNPIAHREGVRNVLEYSAECLLRAESLCRDAFGANALSCSILSAVREHILELAWPSEGSSKGTCLQQGIRVSAPMVIGATATGCDNNAGGGGCGGGGCGGGNGGCGGGGGNEGAGICCIILICAAAAGSGCNSKKESSGGCGGSSGGGCGGSSGGGSSCCEGAAKGAGNECGKSAVKKGCS
jgi:hypothetical protein